MSVRSRALVPLCTEQQAAWRAVAETEKRRHQGNTLAEYPYAGAFFRCLNGSRRISLSDLRFFMPSLTAEELHGNRLQWLYAIDVLIETQGEVCLLPLPDDAAERLFPSVRFRVRERSRHKSALVMQKYSRQQAREAEQKTPAGCPVFCVVFHKDVAARAGLVMTVLTVGLVSCAGKSLPRFWPGDFFPVFYACHLAVLGVLAL